MIRSLLPILLSSIVIVPAFTAEPQAPQPNDARLQPLDVFQLEFVSDPQISPSGKQIVYVRNYFDEQNLFVTGGSGGGVLTAWIVGKTSRFRAAVSAKPVINWYSFALTADLYPFFYRYWFPGFPWDHPEHYLKRSPLSLVGNVTTPTMVLTGEQDYRTPISESEQFYQALKLRKIDTALVRVPGASHDISARPSHLISQVAHTLEWFERHKKK